MAEIFRGPPPEEEIVTSRGLGWRLGLVILVFGAGFAGLTAGAGLTERDVAQADLLTRIYYVLGLFVFGGLDLGVPQGGPLWGRALLWIAFFGAPAITTSAIVEGLLRILRPEAWRLWRLKDHVIVGGCGRFAHLYLTQIRRVSPRQRILVIERSAHSSHMPDARAQRHTDILLGDVSNEAILRTAHLERAKKIYLLTGDDYANLDAASYICDRYPHLASEITVHVSDIQLLRLIEQKNLLPEVRKFNAYRRAARHLVSELLIPHFHLTERRDTVLLAGFGRFGQTVLHQLQQDAAELFETVVLIDLSAKLRADVFEEQVGFNNVESGGYTHHVVDGDLRDPAVWTQVREMIGELWTRPVCVLGSGIDGVNIHTALWLSEMMPDAKIVARCFHQSPFTRQISREAGFEIVSAAELLMASMEAED